MQSSLESAPSNQLTTPPTSQSPPSNQPMTASNQPIHLHPTAPLAERVLLPGDPGRALALAQLLLEQPRMFNHHRGLWGYTGTAADGEPLTIQSTGMGGPSAAIVLHELIALGVRRAIRVGTCGALSPELALGDLVVAREAIPSDGTSTALGAGELACADPALTEALLDRLAAQRYPHRAARIVSTDLFYEDGEAPAGELIRGSGELIRGSGESTRGGSSTRGGGESTRGSGGGNSARAHEWTAAGALAVEMEAATLFVLGSRSGARVGCVLAVSDLLDPSGVRTRIDDRALMQAAETMGAAAAAALGPSSPTAGR
jgi:purine-nucleoside phosphorylase